MEHDRTDQEKTRGLSPHQHPIDPRHQHVPRQASITESENESVRQWFGNIPNIAGIASRRQLLWIGKIARMEEEKVQKKLVMSWTQHPRKGGRLQITYRNTNTWMDIAADKGNWYQHISDWWTTTARPPCNNPPPMPDMSWINPPAAPQNPEPPNPTATEPAPS
jgi:hypothetical protein